MGSVTVFYIIFFLFLFTVNKSLSSFLTGGWPSTCSAGHSLGTEAPCPLSLQPVLLPAGFGDMGQVSESPRVLLMAPCAGKESTKGLSVLGCRSWSVPRTNPGSAVPVTCSGLHKPPKGENKLCELLAERLRSQPLGFGWLWPFLVSPPALVGTPAGSGTPTPQRGPAGPGKAQLAQLSRCLGSS